MSTWSELRQAAQTAWQQRAPRERRLLALGGAVLLLALLWSSLLAPAWRLWREAPQRQAQLEAQTRHMLHMQAEAQQLQAPRRLERAQALQWLSDSAREQLGKEVQLSPQGQELRVSLRAVPSTALAQWLAQARQQAQALPRQVQLQAQADGPAPEGHLWSGTLVLRLP